MINILTILLGIGSIIYLSFPLRLQHQRMKREEQAFQEAMQEGNERMHSAALQILIDIALKTNKTEQPDYEQPIAMYPEQ